MNTTLLTSGIVCLVAAVAGGGLKAFGFEMPILNSLARQIILGAIGLGLLAASGIVKQSGSTASSSSGKGGSSQDSGSGPKRMPATLTLTYEGPVEVLRDSNFRGTPAHTPNNSYNRGNCPNEVRRQDGYCVSRTTSRVQTAPPYLLKNPKIQCIGTGCPWTSPGPTTASPDGLWATASIENWGLDVDIVAVAVKYERVPSESCGATVRRPIEDDGTALFNVRKDCLSVATITWTTPDGSQGAIKVGTRPSRESNLQQVSWAEEPDVIKVTYKYYAK